MEEHITNQNNSLENKLMSCLYRATCPDSLRLGEYQLQLLPTTETAVIAHHLQLCPHCTQELATLDNYLHQLQPDLPPIPDFQPGICQQLKIWVARKFPDNQPTPLRQPAFALRGETDEESGPIMYEAGDAYVTLDIQTDAARPGYKSIIGLIFGVDPSEMKAYVWHIGQLIASTPLDELGNFAINALESGEYDLIVAAPDIEIHIQAVTC